MHAKMCTYTYACMQKCARMHAKMCMRKCASENVQCMHAKMCKKCMHASLAKCAGKTVDKSLPNACPHACFAAYAWPAADRARPCAPFRSTQCNVPAGTACRASRCVLKPTSQRLTFEHSKKRWKMVLIYSQHIWFFFVFFWGDVTVSCKIRCQ